MRPTQNDLGKLIVVRTAQGELVGVGRCVGYTDAPTLTVNTPAGEQIHWRADLCCVVDVDQDAADALIPPKG